MKSSRLRLILLFLGDLAIFYGSLAAVLFIRYRAGFETQFANHFLPFTIILIFWIFVFYISGLYDPRRLRNGLEFLQVLLASIAINATIAFGFFYFIPLFGITPKTNLFAFVGIFIVLETLWRRYFNRVMTALRPASRVALIGGGQAAREMQEFLDQNPQLGYKVAIRIEDANVPDKLAPWRDLVRLHALNFIVIPRSLKKNQGLNRIFFELLDMRVKAVEFPDFFEAVFRRVPLREIDEEWFLEHITQQSLIYNDIKRSAELVVALLLSIVLLPFQLLIALGVLATSRGPAIYKQVRVGKYGHPFTLYKFRTMRVDAEQHGPQWASANDKRTTLIGRVLRTTHLDELPQLLNILRGDLSFVGPRPERPEFVEKLKEVIPYYDVRTFLKPGVTGWAQIHHRADQTIADVERKLEYDIYYLKRRSALLDIVIILRTVKAFFVNPR
jgi:exopolysaccharide biosynthesis polyprenyl glycosylphosphotransferase